MEGSFKLRFMATCERRRSLGIRPSLGEPRLLMEDLRDSLAALILAAEAREMEVLRGEGVSCRFGGEVTVCMDLGCIGEEDIDLDGGKELRSGGAMVKGKIKRSGRVGMRILVLVSYVRQVSE